ncbi:MAG: 3-hydroxyacyl-CoA dehydrogenase [Alphaproteobacteria bacterium]|nr:3-hydroxyacyl-CoA dehydrogenase [Alphaproteobacteria bacterium]
MIEYQVDADGIATIAWAMRDRPMNVLNADSMGLFKTLVERAIADPAVKGAIVTSAKDDFIAGADLQRIFETLEPAPFFERCTTFHALTRTIEKSGKPFVAALNGTALGGGYEIALACHRRIAADRPKMQLGLPEVAIGLMPGGGGTQRLPRLIGARAALPLMLEGKRLDPKAALKAGLVDALVPPAELLAAAKAWILSRPEPVQPWDRKDFKLPDGGAWTPRFVETFMAGTAMLRAKTHGVYPAPRAIMSAVYEGLQVPIDAALRIEARWFTHIVTSPEARGMVRTLFFGLQSANKLANRPKAPAPRKFAKIGVLGAGMMGAGIAFVSAAAGIEVVLIDATLAQAEKGKAYSVGLLDRRVKQGRMTAAERDAVLARIRPSVDYAELAGSQLAIEAVFENRAIKAEVTNKAEAVLAADAVFASNTSTLPISGLAEASARPERFIGLHFFSPVDRMMLVEVIRGAKTSDECLAWALDFVKAIRKTPIVVNDSRGFYTSRVFGTYVNEGLAMLAEGVAPALIENAGRLAGMPVGPLALADEVSLDLMHKVRAQTKADLGKDYRTGPGEAVLTAMVETLGRVGKKAGKGFYAYPESGKKALWPDLAKTFPLAKEQPEAAELIERYLTVQAVETARCVGEKVVVDPADADVGAILGWGFAPQTGGPLSLIEGIGLGDFVARCERLAQRHGPRFTPPALLREMAAKGASFYNKAA